MPLGSLSRSGPTWVITSLEQPEVTNKTVKIKIADKKIFFIMGVPSWGGWGWKGCD